MSAVAALDHYAVTVVGVEMWDTPVSARPPALPSPTVRAGHVSSLSHPDGTSAWEPQHVSMTISGVPQVAIVWHLIEHFYQVRELST